MDMSVTQLREMTKRLKEKTSYPPRTGATRDIMYFMALFISGL